MSVNKEKEEYLLALEERAFLQENLPHLYGWKWYPWARKFFESRKKFNFLCAANQISKSSTQIRKCINWATDITLWSQLWPTIPKQFWYLYPDFKLATGEYKEKWVKEFLPRGPMKDHPVYGWTPTFSAGRYIESIVFNSGVTVYFKSYEQNPSSLQAASLYAVFADEEMPVDIYDELYIRLSAPAINGYFHMAFTATLGQEFWWNTIEEIGSEKENFKKDSLKLQVSMYDCLTYEDGSPSLWTEEKIEEIKKGCKSENEVLRRVYGRFVKSENLQYPGYNESVNLVPPRLLPDTWAVYAGIDPGSGGRAHPSAITFLAVNPEKTRGEVIRCWRGDGLITTSSDLVRIFQDLVSSLGRVPVIQCYDWAARDFMLVAGRMGIPFLPANKERGFGQRVMNSLFKSEMLLIHDSDDGRKLSWELKNLSEGIDKSRAKDDLVDSLRFAVTSVPWDFSVLLPKNIVSGIKRKDAEQKFEKSEKNRWSSVPHAQTQIIDDEIAEFNEILDYYGGESLI